MPGLGCQTPARQGGTAWHDTDTVVLILYAVLLIPYAVVLIVYAVVLILCDAV